MLYDKTLLLNVPTSHSTIHISFVQLQRSFVSSSSTIGTGIFDYNNIESRFKQAIRTVLHTCTRDQSTHDYSVNTFFLEMLNDIESVIPICNIRCILYIID